MNILKKIQIEYCLMIIGLIISMYFLQGCKSKKNDSINDNGEEKKYAELEIEENREKIEQKLNILAEIYKMVESSEKINVKTENIKYDTIDFSFTPDHTGLIISDKKLSKYLEIEYNGNEYDLNPDIGHYDIIINKKLLNNHKECEYDNAIRIMNSFLQTNYILVIKTENYIEPVKNSFDSNFTMGLISGKGYLFSIEPLNCIGIVEFTATNSETVKIYSNDDPVYILNKNLRYESFSKLLENLIKQFPDIKINKPESYLVF